jgi:hypothetical protein
MQLEVTPEEAQVVLAALAELPLKSVHAVFPKVQKQVLEQQKEVAVDANEVPALD